MVVETVGCQNVLSLKRKGGAIYWPFPQSQESDPGYFLLNFLLNPARPSRAETSKSMAVGSDVFLPVQSDLERSFHWDGRFSGDRERLPEKRCESKPYGVFLLPALRGFESTGLSWEFLAGLKTDSALASGNVILSQEISLSFPVESSSSLAIFSPS
jgi:hypothetical protein